MSDQSGASGVERLIFPEDFGGFPERFQAKSRWRHRVSRNLAHDLLPWREFDRLIAEGRLPPERFRIIVNQNNVAAELYADTASNRLRSDALQSMANQGATFLIIGIQDMVPTIGTLVAEIESHVFASVQANAYVSFGEQSAFKAHCDDHDVLVIQVHGSKRWRGYGYSTSFPLKGGPFPGRPSEWEDVLEPGDLLYLPRGEIHAAVPVERPSLHLTIGIGERSGVDFVKALARAAEEHEVFRHSLSRTAVTAQEAALKQALHALVDAASLKDFLDRDDQERRLKPTAAFNVAARLAPDTVLASTLLRRLDLQTDDPRERKLVLGGRSLRLTALERRALDHLTARDSATLSELADALGLPPLDQTLVQAVASLATNALVEIRDQD